MKGLTCRFDIVNGAFSFKESSQRAKDDIWFLCAYDKFRPYSPDFTTGLVNLLQRPTSYISAKKDILLNTLTDKIEGNVSEVKVTDIDLGYILPDRKTQRLKIEFQAVVENGLTIPEVTFV